MFVVNDVFHEISNCKHGNKDTHSHTRLVSYSANIKHNFFFTIS